LIESWYGRRIPVEWHMPGTREAVWVYDLRLPRCVNGYETIDSVVKSLNQLGIAARHSFKPMSAQPEYFRIHNRLNAYRLSKEVMYLPVDPGMDEARVDFICEALFKLVKP
jgi:dTDP-4-amino-4,6-dideoxygalactose transaminase